MSLTIPTLTTDRLTMRGPTQADLRAYQAFNAVSDTLVGAYKGGKTAAQTKAILARDIAHWDKGFGMWMLVLGSGEIIGGAGLVHHDDWPRHELTWWLMPDHRGHGYATEASRAAIAFGYDVLGWDQVETHMRDENLPARKLAQRLGATFLCRDKFPDGVSRDIFVLPQSHVGAAA